MEALPVWCAYGSFTCWVCIWKLYVLGVHMEALRVGCAYGSFTCWVCIWKLYLLGVHMEALPFGYAYGSFTCWVCIRKLYLLGVHMEALPVGCAYGSFTSSDLTSLKKVNFGMTGCLLADLLIIEWYIFPEFIQVLISSWHLCWKCLLKRLRRVYEVTPPTTNE